MINSDKIRGLREAHGWSQAKLARYVGVSQPTIATLENGTNATSRSLPKIASVLGVEVSALDPDYPVGLPKINGETLELETAAIAFESMVERLRPEFSPEERAGLARVFLDLAIEPPDGSSDKRHMMSERLRAVIRPYLTR